MKKVITNAVYIVCFIIMCFSSPKVFASSNTNANLNEIGVKINKVQSVFYSNNTTDSWRDLPAKSNVALDKPWTIGFTDEVTMDKIDGIVIQKDSDFIPVNIAIVDQKQITVRPASNYVANSNYSLKIFLNNGKKIRMNFTTADSSRAADNEDNNSYVNANSIIPGENITGSIGQNGDTTDWYKLVLDRDGILDLSLSHDLGKRIEISLYNKNGDSNDYILADASFDKSVRNITTGLAAGTYYIKVYSQNAGTYKMNAQFNPYTAENDIELNSNYINANSIGLNSTLTGHIGNYCDDGSMDNTDWYKLVVDKDGIVNIDLSHDLGSRIELYLYGKDGNNNDYISSDGSFDKSVRNINMGLAAGTYYVKVYSPNYGTYKISTSFTEDTISNDTEGNSKYIYALNIGANDTKSGHIGYIDDNNGQDAADWYKLVLDKDGTININLSQVLGGRIELYLYGKDGDNNDYISGDGSFDKSVRSISQKLSAGTYYIKVYGKSSGGYNLTTSFEQ